jgi:MoxR-like ATPase
MTSTTHKHNRRFDPPTDPFDLPARPGWPATRHQFDTRSQWAIRAALATGRPLLVRGEPGTGKTQLARAAADVLKRPFLYKVINGRSEVTELLYDFDAVARLSEAQVLGHIEKDQAKAREALSPERFVRPGKVWWALNWLGAQGQAELSRSESEDVGGFDWSNGCVLLVDEIDKADAELPNALLECFANQSFQVDYLKDPVSSHPDQPPPLVIVTTNEERELPAAFLRRCLVLHLDLEREADKLRAFLVERGEVHFKPKHGARKDFKDVLQAAAGRVLKGRSSMSGALHRPGQAEYLDLCRAVFTLSEDAGEGSVPEVMGEVAGFAMVKNPA